MAISIKPEYLKRYSSIARLFWKYGRGDLVAHSGLLETLEPADRAEGAAANPEELARDLEAMGPLYIKLGQLFSSRSDILPTPYLKSLARLQDNIPAFSFADVEQIVEQELGVRMSKAFETFENIPIASASLGQVHEAVLRNGRTVAVKVQRPAIREEIAKDFAALEDIAKVLDEHTTMGTRFHFVDVLDEFRRTVARELDYRREAQNMLEIGRNLRSFDRILIPRPIEDYSTERVLTMDFVRGRKITEIGPLAPLEMNGPELVDQLFRAYLKQILVDGLFHADPHPGNVFLTNDYRIALIDLGMVGRLRSSLQEELLKLLLAISENRADEATAIGLKIGERVDPRERINEAALQHQIVEMLSDQFGGTVSDLKIGSTLTEFTHLTSEFGIRMPAELTMLGKTLFNLDEIGRVLDPNFDPNAAIRKTGVRLTRARLKKTVSPASVLTAAIEAKEFAQELPRRINKILDLLSKNEFTIQVDAIEEQTLIDGFQKIANRITMGVILAALIIGAALLMRVETEFRIFGYPGLAIISFLVAAAGGCWLIAEIAANDRKMKKK